MGLFKALSELDANLHDVEPDKGASNVINDLQIINSLCTLHRRELLSKNHSGLLCFIKS